MSTNLDFQTPEISLVSIINFMKSEENDIFKLHNFLLFSIFNFNNLTQKPSLENYVFKFHNFLCLVYLISTT